MDVTVAKLITLCVLTALTVIFGSLPYFLILRGSRSLLSLRYRELAFACLNCLAGGVFLGTLLLHLMTEGAEEFETYKNNVGWESDYPFFNTFVFGGLFLVALVEHFMHSCMHHGHSHGNTEEEHVFSEENRAFEGSHNHNYGAIEPSPPIVNETTSLITGSEQVSSSCKDSKLMDVSCVHVHSPMQDTQDCENNIEENSTHLHGNHHLHNSVEHLQQPHVHGFKAFLLLMALSFHTIFDGLAVGLQVSEDAVWTVFAAISIHKSIIAFCLGFEMFKTYQTTPCKAFLWMCMFAIMSPVGIGIGMILTEGNIDENAKLLSSSILQGVASGVFLYVTFLEILCSYMGHSCVRGSKFIYFICTALGFGIMAFVKAIDND